MENQTHDITRYVIGLLVLLGVAVPLAAKFLPKVKIKFPDLRWIGKLLSGKMFIAALIWLIAVVSVRGFWRTEWEGFKNEHGWYFWLIVVGGGILFCYLFGRKHESKAQTGGGHQKSPWLAPLMWLGLAVVIVSVWASTKELEFKKKLQQLAGRSTMGYAEPRRFTVVAQVDAETPAAFVPTEFSWATRPVEKERQIWVRFGNGPRVPDWQGNTNTYPKGYFGADRTVYVQAKDGIPTVVEVELNYQNKK